MTTIEIPALRPQPNRRAALQHALEVMALCHRLAGMLVPVGRSWTEWAWSEEGEDVDTFFRLLSREDDARRQAESLATTPGWWHNPLGPQAGAVVRR